MLRSQFYEAVDDVLGPTFGRSILSDLYLTGLQATPNDALARGDDPQQVWSAIVAELDLDPRVEWIHRADAKQRRALTTK